MSDLKGKVVVITGGAKGIGRVIAERLADRGAKLAITSRSESALLSCKNDLEAKFKTQVIVSAGDVRQVEFMKAFYAQVAKDLGPVYGVVAAAGVYGEISSFKECDLNKWIEGIEINLIGTAITVHSALPHMKDSAGGRILLFSGGGQAAMSNFSCYVTGKGGIWRLTETLGAELAKERIYVNSMAPGAANTQFVDDLIDAGPSKAGLEAYHKALQQKKEGGQPIGKAADLTEWLFSAKAQGLYGKTISAQWDDYTQWNNLEKISSSDLYTFKRVIDEAGNTKPKK